MYVTTTNSALSVILEGKEQLFSFKASVVVPRSSIVSLRFEKEFSDWRSIEIRMPGSYVPAWLMAGSFWTEEGWDFVFSKKPKGVVRPVLNNVLVIETDLTRFRRVIVGMPATRANELINWWKSS